MIQSKRREKKACEEWEKGLPKSQRAIHLLRCAKLRKGEDAVTIRRTTETGEMLWAIEVDIPKDDPWWLNTFSTLRECKEFCKEMGWPVKNVMSLTQKEIDDWHLVKRRKGR